MGRQRHGERAPGRPAWPGAAACQVGQLPGIGHAGDGRSIVATKSAISRRFVQGTGQKLAELFGRDLSQLDLLAISIDGIEIVEHCVVLALGDDAEGRKHPLGLWEGTIENKTVGNALLGNLIERGLDPSSRRCS